MTTTAKTPGASYLAHVNTRVLLDNDRVRVLEMRVEPGERLEMHDHPALVAYVLADANCRFEYPDGRSEEVELRRGDAMFREAESHAFEVTGSAASHLLLVELKS